jgi:GntR family transcriptional regulator
MDYDKNTGFVKIPKYVRVYQSIRELIESGEYPPNSLLPYERELEEIYSVSRVTVREALSLLSQENLIRKVQGVGSIVQDPQILRERLFHITSFSQKMHAEGFTVTSKVLSVGLMQPDECIREILQLQPATQVVELIRLRSVDGIPTVIAQSLIPNDIGISLDDDFSGSLYELFSERLELVPTRRDATVQAVAADAYHAEHLMMEEGDPILKVCSVAWSHSKPIEYSKQMFRGDRYNFTT